MLKRLLGYQKGHFRSLKFDQIKSTALYTICELLLVGTAAASLSTILPKIVIIVGDFWQYSK